MVTNYDINEDGVDELVTGWTSGKVDIRNPDTGQILFKDSFSSPVAGIAKVCSICTNTLYMFIFSWLVFICTHTQCSLSASFHKTVQ